MTIRVKESQVIGIFIPAFFLPCEYRQILESQIVLVCCEREKVSIELQNSMKLF